MTRPRRVISGGQTGVDQAGLRAARACGIETGGVAPRGWMTETGPARALLEGFGLREHGGGGYLARTRANIIEADATIIFGNLESTGSTRTAQFARALSTPLVRVRWPNARLLDEMARDVRAWIARNDFNTVNVAGNRESVMPGIGGIAEAFFTAVFI